VCCERDPLSLGLSKQFPFRHGSGMFIRRFALRLIVDMGRQLPVDRKIRHPPKKQRLSSSFSPHSRPRAPSFLRPSVRSRVGPFFATPRMRSNFPFQHLDEGRRLQNAFFPRMLIADRFFLFPPSRLVWNSTCFSSGLKKQSSLASGGETTPVPLKRAFPSNQP